MKPSAIFLSLLWICSAALCASPAPKRTSSIPPISASSPSFTAAPSSPLDDLLTLVNQFRQQNGLGPLAINLNLQSSAQEYAGILATSTEFSHTIGGRNALTEAKSNGFTGSVLGENIARGFNDANSVMLAWEASPGHRANLLYPTYGIIGLGMADGPSGRSWVQDFSPPLSGGTIPPVVIPPVVLPPLPPPTSVETFTVIGRYIFYLGSKGNYVLAPIN